MMQHGLFRVLVIGALLAPGVCTAQAVPDASGYRMTMVGSTTATGMLAAAMPSSDVTY